MKKINFNCICGKKYNLISNSNICININICSNCHFFFSKNIISNSSNRIKTFKKKYENFFKE